METGTSENGTGSSREATPVINTPLWRRSWPWLVGLVGGVALLLSNVTSILTNARALPSEIRKTSEQFFAWYDDYDGWKGTWTNDPEGLIDAASLNLSSQPFRLEIDESASGEIAGTVESSGICDRLPFFESLLVEGSISSSKRATIRVFEVIGGYRREFAQLRLERAGQVMRVMPLADPAGAFPRESRVALDPQGIGGPDSREAICPKKRQKFIERVLGNAGKIRSRP